MPTFGPSPPTMRAMNAVGTPPTPRSTVKPCRSMKSQRIACDLYSSAGSSGTFHISAKSSSISAARPDQRRRVSVVRRSGISGCLALLERKEGRVDLGWRAVGALLKVLHVGQGCVMRLDGGPGDAILDNAAMVIRLVTVGEGIVHADIG